jgi:hypothetical protein
MGSLHYGLGRITEKPTVHPTIAAVAIPTFVMTYLVLFPHLRASAAIASAKYLNNLHNSLRAMAFNLIQIKKPVPKARA